MNHFNECNPRAVLVVNESKKTIDNQRKLIYIDLERKKVSGTIVSLVGLHRSLNRLCPTTQVEVLTKKIVKDYFCHRDVNAAFNISRRGDKTVGEKVLTVGLIDDPPNWTAQKGVELESSGGAR